MKCILVVTKSRDSKGGVSHYYNTLEKYFNDDEFTIRRFAIGSRPKDYLNRRRRHFMFLIEFLSDIIALTKLLRKDNNIKIVQVSPSLIPWPILRDTIICLLAKIHKRRVVTFIRGWDKEFYRKTESSLIWRRIISVLISKSEAVLCLANKFKNDIGNLGFDEKKIKVLRTLSEPFENTKGDSRTRREGKLNITYIGRLSEYKGVMDMLEATRQLKSRMSEFTLSLYGHFATKEFSELCLGYLSRYNLQNVSVYPYIEGEEKSKVLEGSDAFMLPSYNEGCPNAMIEALTHGLFVVCTPIGAMDELVDHKSTGFIVEVSSPTSLFESVEWMLDNRDAVEAGGLLNMNVARESLSVDYHVRDLRFMYRSILE